jgi:hypothetical protein
VERDKLIGQKPSLKLSEVRAIRLQFQLEERLRDLAMFNLAIDNKLRGCDLVASPMDDVLLGGRCGPGPRSCRTKPRGQCRPSDHLNQIISCKRTHHAAWISATAACLLTLLQPQDHRGSTPIPVGHGI